MRTKLIVGLTVAIGAVILFFLAGGGKGKQVFYMTPSEYLASSAKSGDRARLTGKVMKDSVKVADNKLDLNFMMGDGQKQIPIHFKGTIPEAFAEDLEVVVDGRMAGDTFEGKEIIVKCPSKYESKLKEEEKKGT
jgi:cytochrome c-type biogenesis protein CcmE